MIIKTKDTISSIYKADSSKYNSVQFSLGPLNYAENVKYVMYKQLANVAINEPVFIIYIIIVITITTMFMIDIVRFKVQPSN